MTDDEALSQSSDPTTVPVVPDPTRCSACGLPLHVKNGGYGFADDGVTPVWVTPMICTNNSLNGSGNPCGMLDQVQGIVKSAMERYEG
jgi:hypothetical protein